MGWRRLEENVQTWVAKALEIYENYQMNSYRDKRQMNNDGFEIKFDSIKNRIIQRVPK